jgi:hypothetical protein
VDEAQLGCVEKVAVPKQSLAAATVDTVANDWVPHPGHVYANLVGAARLRSYLN